MTSENATFWKRTLANSVYFLKHIILKQVRIITSP